MHRTLSLCAIAVGLFSAVVTGHQPAAHAVLSDALRAHQKDERFDLVTSVRGLPLGVRDDVRNSVLSGVVKGTPKVW